MTQQGSTPGDQTPTVEVRIFQRGELVHTELAESEVEAALLVEQWLEFDGVTCEVRPLTPTGAPDDAADLDPLLDGGDEDYPPAG